MYLLFLIVLFALWAQPMELLSLQLFCSHDTVITMQEWEKYYLFVSVFIKLLTFLYQIKSGDCQPLHAFLSLLGEHEGFFYRY